METHLDLLFFAIVAFFFFARLWSILGRQENDDDKKLPPLQNPFAKPPEGPQQNDIVVLPGKAREETRPSVITENGFAVASLAGALDQLKSIDPTFDEKQFLEGAKSAFRMIVDSFAAGDLSKVERILAPSVLASFKGSILPDAPVPTKPRVDRISEAALSAVQLSAAEVRLTVDFTSLQCPASTPGQTIEIHDRWIFARPLGTTNPNWILVATSA